MSVFFYDFLRGTMMRNREGKHLKTVSEVCGELGITRKTLFYYDRIGLLVPAERIGPQSHKMYSETEISRLKEILKYRQAGLSISEISRILGQDSSIRKEVLLEVLERMMKQKKEMETNILSVRGLLESI